MASFVCHHLETPCRVIIWIGLDPGGAECTMNRGAKRKVVQSKRHVESPVSCPIYAPSGQFVYGGTPRRALSTNTWRLQQAA